MMVSGTPSAGFPAALQSSDDGCCNLLRRFLHGFVEAEVGRFHKHPLGPAKADLDKTGPIGTTTRSVLIHDTDSYAQDSVGQPAEARLEPALHSRSCFPIEGEVDCPDMDSHSAPPPCVGRSIVARFPYLDK